MPTGTPLESCACFCWWGFAYGRAGRRHLERTLGHERVRASRLRVAPFFDDAAAAAAAPAPSSSMESSSMHRRLRGPSQPFWPRAAFFSASSLAPQLLLVLVVPSLLTVLRTSRRRRSACISSKSLVRCVGEFFLVFLSLPHSLERFIRELRLRTGRERGTMRVRGLQMTVYTHVLVRLLNASPCVGRLCV